MKRARAQSCTIILRETSSINKPSSKLINMSPMMTLFLTLAMMTGSGLGSSCLRNEDCASACCSGYGWCVGPQSGDIQDIFRN